MSEERKNELPEDVSVVDLLLRPETPNVLKTLPRASYKVKRLSDALGAPVVFELQGLPFGRVQEIRRSKGNALDVSVDILLAGVVSPDLKDGRLQSKFSGITPAETVKAMLLPGEIDDLAEAIEQLSGYRTSTIELIKNG